MQVPKGILPGQTIRLAGQGGRPHAEGAAGDLYIEVEFQPHPLYRIDGRDLYLDLPVAPWEAALGATVKTPTPTGTVDLKIPAGAHAGTKLRLKARGIPCSPPGDFYVVLQIALPAADDDQAKAAYRAMADAHAVQSTRQPRSVIAHAVVRHRTNVRRYCRGIPWSSASTDLCRMFAVDERHIVELVEEGVLSVIEIDASEWRFSGAALRRARIALRLERDLGVNLPGVALALDLLEELEQLRRAHRRSNTDERARIRRFRIFRRHRRSGVQEDLPRALRHGAPRRPADSDHRHGARRLESRSSCATARARVWNMPANTTAEGFAKLAAQLRYVDGDYADPRTYQTLRKGAGSRQPSDPLSRHSAEHVRERRHGAGEIRLRGERAGDRREAVRPRFGDRASARRHAARGISGGIDLSHRSLSRQGGGAKPAVLPLRQYVSRTDLESPVRQGRADHHGGVIRRAGPRRLLRGSRRDPRRRAESSAAGDCAVGHGSSGGP